MNQGKYFTHLLVLKIYRILFWFIVHLSIEGLFNHHYLGLVSKLDWIDDSNIRYEIMDLQYFIARLNPHLKIFKTIPSEVFKTERFDIIKFILHDEEQYTDDIFKQLTKNKIFRRFYMAQLKGNKSLCTTRAFCHFLKRKEIKIVKIIWNTNRDLILKNPVDIDKLRRSKNLRTIIDH